MRMFALMSMRIVFCSSLFRRIRASRSDYVADQGKFSSILSLRRNNVHATHVGYCTVHDDYQRHLLGFLGQHLQGRKELSFRLFYWDYAVGIFLVSLILALHHGQHRPRCPSFLNNVHSADTSNIVYTLVGGAISTWRICCWLPPSTWLDSRSRFRFRSVLRWSSEWSSVTEFSPREMRDCWPLGSVRFSRRDTGRQSVRQPGQAGGRVSQKSIVTCIVSGVLMGLWAPFVTRAMTHGKRLGPYSVAVFLTLGALLSCLIWNIYFMKTPAGRRASEFQRIVSRTSFRTPSRLLGGFIWGIGTGI